MSSRSRKWSGSATPPRPFKGRPSTSSPRPFRLHVYESKTIAKAFEEITGIKVKHDVIQEGDVMEKLQTQMQSGSTSTTCM